MGHSHTLHVDIRAVPCPDVVYLIGRLFALCAEPIVVLGIIARFLAVAAPA